MSTNSRFIKTLAAVTATAMLLVIVLAGIFIVMEADHDCEGEDCPVCQCLENCQATLRQLGSAAVTASVPLFSFFLLITTGFHILKVFFNETPVSTKVRLND